MADAAVQYSLSAIFTSEFLATTLAIFIGTSAVANELLPSTKGHGMGYFATGLAFVTAFFVSASCFGSISAEMNPAMFLYLALRGQLRYGWREFAAGCAADVLGAFLGGCFTFLFFAEHFFTIPLPQDPDPVSRLVHGPPDALSNDAGRLASAFGDASRPKEDDTFRDEVISFGENIVSGGTGSFTLRGRDRSTRRLGEEEGEGDGANGGIGVNGEDAPTAPMESHQRLMAEMENERLNRAASSRYMGSSFYNLPMDTIPENSSNHSSDSTGDTGTNTECGSGTSSSRSSSRSSDSRMQWQEEFRQNDLLVRSADDFRNNTAVPLAEAGMLNRNKATTTCSDNTKQKKKKHVKFKSLVKKKHIKPNTMSEIRDAAFEAAIRADQAAKLSVFATRPAKYNRVANFLQEMGSTIVLIVVIQMLNLRLEFDPSLKAKTSPYTQALSTSFFVTAMVLGLGGTTGFAVNPCRDLGPRIVHWLMPIPGKGPSEWHYGWVPVAGPMVGACIAAACMIGLEELYASGY